ncbi:ATP-binding protein [Nocardia wallacei]|uniref:ATP-binding protein n=1 Tax=Nocardia wallacei TaxID=480035 RepID=UPI002454394F|nr:ATP-binding protein [Nocardia wallacei]
MTGLSSGPVDEGEAHGADIDVDAVMPRQIREAVRVMLTPRTGVVVDDAVLVADELITNALEHGQPPRRVRLRLRTCPARLRIEVDDHGVGVPYLRAPDDGGGRGMTVIDRMATGWGVIDYTGFKTVWAEMPLDRPRIPPDAPPPPTGPPDDR